MVICNYVLPKRMFVLNVEKRPFFIFLDNIMCYLTTIFSWPVLLIILLILFRALLVGTQSLEFAIEVLLCFLTVAGRVP